MDVLGRFVTFLRTLRNPDRKPEDVAVLDQRLDAVERRLEEARRRRLQTEFDTMRRAK